MVGALEHIFMQPWARDIEQRVLADMESKRQAESGMRATLMEHERLGWRNAVRAGSDDEGGEGSTKRGADSAGGHGGKRQRTGQVGVLMVCMNNVSRSPCAAMLFMAKAKTCGVADRFYVDSCGTGAGNSRWYSQENGAKRPTESRASGSEAARAAAKRGLALSGTTRHLRKDDLLGFDYILAMDDAVLSEISDASRSWGEPYASAANTKAKLLGKCCGKVDVLKPTATRGNSRCQLPESSSAVPGGEDGILDILEDGCGGLLCGILQERGATLRLPAGALEAAQAARLRATAQATNNATQAIRRLHSAQRPAAAPKQTQQRQQRPPADEDAAANSFFEEGELASCDKCAQRLKAPVRCNVLVCPNCKQHVRAIHRR